MWLVRTVVFLCWYQHRGVTCIMHVVLRIHRTCEAGYVTISSYIPMEPYDVPLAVLPADIEAAPGSWIEYVPAVGSATEKARMPFAPVWDAIVVPAALKTASASGKFDRCVLTWSGVVSTRMVAVPGAKGWMANCPHQQACVRIGGRGGGTPA